MKNVKEERKNLKEKFDKFMQNHEKVRDEKKKIERDIDREKTRNRIDLIKSEEEYREKRERSNEKHLLDLY